MAGVEVIVESGGHRVVVTPILDREPAGEPQDQVGAIYRRQALGEHIPDPVLLRLRRRFLNPRRTALGF